MFPPSFEIAGRKVGTGEPCLIIAEGGVSHLGNLSKAFRLIDMAVEAGADVFKTQHYHTSRLVGPSSPEWRKRLASKELPDDYIRQMQRHCERRHILFLCTPHDDLALEFLDKVLALPAFKVGSGEVENWPYLADLACRGKPLILSTGMYEMSQIKQAVDIIAKNGAPPLAIMHCVTCYPTDPQLVNLKAMDEIRDFFTGPVGYSDHTESTAVALAAVALGAQLIEKHITLDRDIPDAQDWKVACDASNFAQFISDIRTVEAARGGGAKIVTEIEHQSIRWARKSLTARVHIKAGSMITPEVLLAQRPGTGIPASQIAEITGRHARIDIGQGEILLWSMLD